MTDIAQEVQGDTPTQGHAYTLPEASHIPLPQKSTTPIQQPDIDKLLTSITSDGVYSAASRGAIFRANSEEKGFLNNNFQNTSTPIVSNSGKSMLFLPTFDVMSPLKQTSTTLNVASTPFLSAYGNMQTSSQQCSMKNST